MSKNISVRVKRQDGPNQPSRWEEFQVEYKQNLNVISVLQMIQKNPVKKDGHKTTPVVWDCSCLEEVCGACTMVINGQVRQSCSALVDKITTNNELVLEPMSKFPVVRDLMVDRSKMFEALKRVKAWIPIDGTYDLGPGQRMQEVDRVWAYKLSECMTCGCCLEVCPQYNEKSPFIGAHAINQARLFNTHPTGKMNSEERLEALMGDGGISDCGNAQNCVSACPKGIPLTTSIGAMGRATTISWLKNLFNI